MRSIKIEKCNDPMKLIEIIQHLINHITIYPKLKLLVIDSMPALWFLFHGNKKSYGLQNLATLTDLLRKLAIEYGIVVLTINVETRSNAINSQSKLKMYLNSIFFEEK